MWDEFIQNAHASIQNFYGCSTTAQHKWIGKFGHWDISSLCLDMYIFRVDLLDMSIYCWDISIFWRICTHFALNGIFWEAKPRETDGWWLYTFSSRTISLYILVRKSKWCNQFNIYEIDAKIRMEKH
jgi:hypothetical protein